MYIKLAFAVAANLDSDIMIMDEVLAVGDVRFQQKCISKMRNLANNSSKTILYVSHNMATVRQLCTRGVVLDEGRVVFDGDVEEAIRVYSGKATSQSTTVDLTGVKREYKHCGLDVKLNQLEVVSPNSTVFEQGNDLRIKLDFSSTRSVRQMSLKVNIATVDDRPVGSLSILDNINCETGKYSTSLTLPIKNLMVGNYKLGLSLIKATHEEYECLDSIQNVLEFEISEKKEDLHILETAKYRYGLFKFEQEKSNIVTEKAD